MKRSRLSGAAGAGRSHTAAVAAVGAAAALLVNAAPARAALEDTVTEQRTVRFGDLDLSKPQDAERLYQRIRIAAMRVCGEPSPLDLFESRNARQCQEDAIGQAVAQVNNPRLTALYDRNRHHA